MSTNTATVSESGFREVAVDVFRRPVDFVGPTTGANWRVWESVEIGRVGCRWEWRVCVLGKFDRHITAGRERSRKAAIAAAVTAANAITNAQRERAV